MLLFPRFEFEDGVWGIRSDDSGQDARGVHCSRCRSLRKYQGPNCMPYCIASGASFEIDHGIGR
jgi:hypothetical protein